MFRISQCWFLEQKKKRKEKSSTVDLSLSQNVSPNAFIYRGNEHFFEKPSVCKIIAGARERGKVWEAKCRRNRESYSPPTSPCTSAFTRKAQSFCGTWIQSGRIEEKAIRKLSPPALRTGEFGLAHRHLPLRVPNSYL